MSTVAVFIALGGGAYAVSALPSKTVNACVNKKSGSLRVLSKSTRCRRSERKLAFNQRGPVGATGAAGAAGQPGPPGPAGVDGAAIAARPSGTATVTTASAQQTYPLTGNTWTQAAGEVNMIVGKVTIASSPSYSTNGETGCDPGSPRGLHLTFLVNGEDAGQVAFYRTNTVADIALSIPGNTGRGFASTVVPLVAPPAADRTSTLEVRVSDDCNTQDQYTISGLRLNVLRFR